VAHVEFARSAVVGGVHAGIARHELARSAAAQRHASRGQAGAPGPELRVASAGRGSVATARLRRADGAAAHLTAATALPPPPPTRLYRRRRRLSRRRLATGMGCTRATRAR